MKSSGRLFRRLVTCIITVIFTISVTSFSYAAEVNNQNSNFKPTDGQKIYKSSNQDLDNLYKLVWYESQARNISRGEFMLLQLRTIQASLERRGIEKLSSSEETLDFKDASSLSASVQDEAKILESLGILTKSSDGNMNFKNLITRAEAAKVLYVANDKVLKMLFTHYAPDFDDTQNSWAKDMIKTVCNIGLMYGITDQKFNPNGNISLEESVQILDNEVTKYSSIERSDIAKALSQTFKVTVNPDLLKFTSYYSEPKYEEDMNTFYFNRLYNNESAKSNESVTKAEALKMVLAAIFNTNDISGFAKEYSDYPDQIWVEYAKFWKITTEDININNYNDKAKYIDVITYLERAKKQFLKDQEVKEAKVSFKDISVYNSEQEAAIEDLVATGILTTINDNLDGNSYITKGKLNELVVNVLINYNTLAMRGDTINTDISKMPLNAKLYPYVLTSVDNTIYEIPFYVEYLKEFKTPKELFGFKKDSYSQIKEYSEGFFNTILNIDYKTITEEGLSESLSQYMIYPPNETWVKEYVKYVKDNEITIKGDAKLQIPVVYFDGASYRIRLKLDFKVINSKTKNNLLYLDMLDNRVKTYQNTDNNLVVDYYMSNAYGCDTMFMDEHDLYDAIMNKQSCNVTRSNYNH